LAVVVDDAAQGITEVVRGVDLLSTTARHILLQTALNASTPSYAHLPLAVDSSGRKLSKSSQSVPIEAANASHLIWHSLNALGQSPPLALHNAPLPELWTWAIGNWSLAPLLGQTTYRAPTEVALPRQ
jgi:glutamyl-Q tRNA(Asp) synthetase